MAKIPESAATMTPAIMGPAAPVVIPSESRSGTSRITDPRMEGMEIRKANLTARALSRPVIRLPNSVDPDRETPGQMAMPCMIPTNTAFRNFMVSMVLSCLPLRSASSRMNPVKISPREIPTREEYRLSKKSSNRSPMRAVGMVATMIMNPSRRVGLALTLRPLPVQMSRMVAMSSITSSTISFQ